ncbi:hypothetical protein HZF24_09045 [Sedimentibacter hydroxybenzoicus DSM 7310]|uniref:Uncharacterized protein n=1 Tax=Sedimentibacter hydroxybenzoicus DSM 7310 TaxID=1123245 RepID=A0A974GWQ3_SEDHY|nr:hypothetical protein [Sedimentibacter hydroxybenzoicus]NYB74290.1 hypothetical protein [Sedimentibacter hydroxybenzoicus DSM 7310]
MKDEERIRSLSLRKVLILLVPCIAVMLIYSGVFSEVHAGITKPATRYRDVKEQFHNMHDNICAAEIYMGKNAVLTDEAAYDYDKICSYPEEAMLFINDLCENNAIEINSMRLYHESDAEEVLVSEIEFECTYECLLSFMDDVKNKGFNAAVSSVNVFVLGGGGRFNAVVGLNFYFT